MSLIRCRLLIEKESCVHESMNRNIKQNKKMKNTNKNQYNDLPHLFICHLIPQSLKIT